MNLYLFDFDDTIAKLPYEECIDYMETSESLNPKEHQFKIIEKTKKDYQKAVSDENGLVFLLSNRSVTVKKPLKKLLDKLNFKFEDLLLVDKNRSKADRITKILKKHPEIKEVHLWEDKDKHIEDVNKKLEEYPIELTITKTAI
jgi:hypothetical protein